MNQLTLKYAKLIYNLASKFNKLFKPKVLFFHANVFEVNMFFFNIEENFSQTTVDSWKNS